MDSKDAERFMDELFEIMPVLHKKLVNIMDEGNSGELSHYHFIILNMLVKNDDLSVSEIGKKISVSRPQMTAMIDKLVSLELVTRLTDPHDRRVIRISITRAGRGRLSRARKRMIGRLGKTLGRLDEKDLELFLAAISNIRKVGQKIE
jgi:DNA-binding MarR family transcriptional regulator